MTNLLYSFAWSCQEDPERVRQTKEFFNYLLTYMKPHQTLAQNYTFFSEELDMIKMSHDAIS